MKIELDTANLSAQDIRILQVLCGESAVVPKESRATITPATASVPAPVEPTPEPVVPTSEADTAGGEADTADASDLIAPADPAEPAVPSGRTMNDAIAIVTKMVSSGKSADVKAALAVVGAKRVSEVPPESIELFLTELGE